MFATNSLQNRTPKLVGLAMLTAALASGAANAMSPTVVTHSLGTLTSAGETLGFAASGLSGSFAEKLSFELGATLGLKGDFSWRNRSTSSISGFDATLYRADGSAVVSDSESGAARSLFDPYPAYLTAGSYYVLISGTGGGSSGGTYSAALLAMNPTPPTLTATLTPVPETETWTMLLAGLLIMGARVHRAVHRPDVGRRIA